MISVIKLADTSSRVGDRDAMLATGHKINLLLNELDSVLDRFEALLGSTLAQWAAHDGTPEGMEAFITTWESRFRRMAPTFVVANTIVEQAKSTSQ